MAPKTNKSASSILIKDLRNHAKKHGINLHGATTKKEITSHIQKHGSLHLVKPGSRRNSKIQKGGVFGCSGFSCFRPNQKGDTGAVAPTPVDNNAVHRWHEIDEAHNAISQLYKYHLKLKAADRQQIIQKIKALGDVILKINTTPENEQTPELLTARDDAINKLNALKNEFIQQNNENLINIVDQIVNPPVNTPVETFHYDDFPPAPGQINKDASGRDKEMMDRLYILKNGTAPLQQPGGGSRKKSKPKPKPKPKAKKLKQIKK